jgi:hypothetical protein
MNTKTQTYSYGDTFTLPAFPGVLWKVCDRRDLEHAGDPHETRAQVRPVDPENPTSGAVRNISIKIGRAERAGVVVNLRMQRVPGWITGTTAADRLTAYGSTDHYETSLTVAQSKMISDEFGKLSFNLPPLSAAEIVEKMTHLLTYAAERGARELSGAMPDRYNGNRPGSAREAVAAALTPAARDAIITAAGEAFTAAARNDLARY